MKSSNKIHHYFCLLPLVIAIQHVYAGVNFSSSIHDAPMTRSIKHVPSKYLGPIMAGAGYSHDSQQIAPNACYAVDVHEDSQGGVVNLNTAMSFSELEKNLHIDISAKGKYGEFSAEAEADYFRTIQDLDYSLSLNYYEYLFDTVSLSFQHPDGLKILNDKGLSIYQNNFKHFSLLCGDDYISSYQQGALLIMGINIRFKSHLDKEEFNAKASGSFGDLYRASAEIQNLVKQYNMQGTVYIQAYQKGGNPAELSEILSKDASGTYYALSCNLQKMDDCVKAASGLLGYARDKFSKQVVLDPKHPDKEIGLTPLGAGFTRHLTVANYLSLPPSLVTKEVMDNRNFLANALDENQYYRDKLDQLVNSYPARFDLTSDFYKKIAKLYKYSGDNIDIISSPYNRDDGALRCYTDPESCTDTSKKIKDQVQPITSNLSVLDTLRWLIKFNIYVDPRPFYPVQPNHFINPQNTPYEGDMVIANNIISISRLNLKWGPYWTWTKGDLAKNDENYIGNLCDMEHGQGCLIYSASLLPNPFYFLPYQPE